LKSFLIPEASSQSLADFGRRASVFCCPCKQVVLGATTVSSTWWSWNSPLPLASDLDYFAADCAKEGAIFEKGWCCFCGQLRLGLHAQSL